MDPAAITASVVREVARSGNFGAHAHDVWSYASRAANQPLDDVLKDSVWLWLAQHPAVQIEHDRVYANEDLQWLELTGNPKQGNIVPQLAFNVLCAVAHSREAGISTVDVAKQAGQDPRSLFGRVQLLADLGLVQRFPVIEKGSSTHRIVLAPYASLHTQGQAAGGDLFVDKQMARKQIVEFCQSGPQGLRLKRDLVSQIGARLTPNAQRRRPLVASLLKDLEARGYVRSVQVYDPASPSRSYVCIQYVKDYQVSGPEKRSNEAWTDTVVDASEGGLDADDPAPEDADNNDKQADTEPVAEALDLSRAVAHSDALNTSDSVQGNVVLPLVNQIHDIVFAAGSQGISAMDLTRKLTGKSYSKALGKYLDALTGDPKAKKPKGKSSQPAQFGNLSLIKGVDFSHRVKYYRYFTRMTYPGGAIDSRWGSFSSSPACRDPDLSLKILDAQSQLPLPGGCSVVETEDGEIRPVFHGDKTTAGKTLLLSDPSRALGSTASTATPPKRRGRPPKNAPRPPPSEPKTQQPSKQTVPPPPIESVRLRDRQWAGGLAVESKSPTPSRWLQPNKTEFSPQKDVEATTSIPQSQESSPTELVVNKANGTRGKNDAESKANGGSSAHGSSVTPDTPAAVSTDKSLGSLAFKRRSETLLALVRENNGAVIGGQDLVDRFNAAVKGDSLVDRKTIDRVIKSLVREGVLRQIFVNMPTMTGIHLMKYILFDPTILGDADSSEVIAKLKQELNEGTRNKQAAAAKAAVSQNRMMRDQANHQQMTLEQATAFRPLLGQRLATTSTRTQRAPVATRRFGVSAAEVARTGPSGASTGPKRTKRGSKQRLDIAVAPSDDMVPEYYGSGGAVNNGRTPNQAPAAQQQRPAVPPVDRDWLFRAVVVVRTLFPRGKSIDWALIAQSAPAGVTEKSLRQQWAAMRDEYHEAVASRANEWEDLFVQAYAEDDVIFLKPADPGFTLSYYVDWWRVAEQSQAMSQSSERRKYRLSDLPLKSKNLDSKLLDPLGSLQSQPSMIRAEELLVRTLLGAPLDGPPIRWKHSLRLSDDAARLRAVIAADGGSEFSAQEAARELQALSEEKAKQALTELERNKYIQWAVSDPEKVPTGRPYILSEKVMNMLAPPARLERDLPSKAADAVANMPSHGMIDIPETVDESQMIPLLEMATFGLDGKHVELRRLGERSGRLSTHYRSRDIDKGELDCDIRAQVDAEAGHASLMRAHQIAPPELEQGSHPCIWQTSHLKGTAIWNTVIYKLLTTVLFRPGMPREVLTFSLRHVLEKEEITKAIDTLVSEGALRDENGGLTTAPDWFSYVS